MQSSTLWGSRFASMWLSVLWHLVVCMWQDLCSLVAVVACGTCYLLWQFEILACLAVASYLNGFHVSRSTG